MQPEPTCAALLALPLLEHAARRGLDRGALCSAVGLDAAGLSRPEAPIPLAAYYELVERAAASLEDPGFGLAAGLAMGEASLGAVGFLGMTSATLGDGLRAMLAWHAHSSEGERYELTVRGERAHLRYLPHGPARAAHAQLADFFIADLATHVPPLVEGGVAGPTVAIRGDSSRAARLAAALRVPVRPAAAFDELSFDAASLARPMRRADPAMRGFFEHYLAEHTAPLPDSFGDRVRRAIDVRLPGPLDAPVIAGALRSSVRTLQRRLRDEGLSLSRLLRERRLCRAQELLDAGKSMSEAAFEAGYSEASALHRALRRR